MLSKRTAPITLELRSKVFGPSAARSCKLPVDEMRRYAAAERAAAEKAAHAERPNPSFVTHGPRTGREFANFLRASGGRPEGTAH